MASVALQFAALVSSVAMVVPRTSRLGVGCWVGLLLVSLRETWPYTINHRILELFISIVLLGYPARLNGPARQDGRNVRLLWFALLTVWIYAAIQKIVHGQYLNGEFMALELVTKQGELASFIRGFLEPLQRALGDAPNVSRFPVELTTTPVSLSLLERGFCVAAGWGVVLGELSVAACAVLMRNRPRAVALVALGQVGLAVTSGEHDFAFTALALVGLGVSRSAPVRYGLLSICVAAFYLFQSSWRGSS